MAEADTDEAGNKRGTSKIETLRAALNRFLAIDVHNEPKLQANGELAILTFGNGVVPALTLGNPVLPGSPFHFIRNVTSTPDFPVGGNTPMGAAIGKALDIIDARKQSLAESGITHEFRPNVFLLTDGRPNDAREVLDDSIKRLHAEEARNGVLLWALGTQDAYAPWLERIADKGNYLPLPGNSLAQFLRFVSKSMRRQGGRRGEEDAATIYHDVTRNVSFDEAVDALLDDEGGSARS
ncbi:hypothetical protein Ato02nite_074160 [Paractinoplanes toevensis]|uniref:VWFA domain-containing protein n=2 Tax=Paractinoplanes toevensis TaxID=571911 RepID=A0A919THR5_9ACTN|nr:hypothetical protein Ato02nite_074160 [Actinoplanes toevensis]